MSGARVSVIIPTFNRAELVGDAIASVLGQTHRDCQAIVIDDGSTDGTEQLVRDRFGSESRVRYERLAAHRGVAAARNAGLAVSQGDYVAFLDPGDMMRPWKVELQVACLQKLHKDGVGMLWTDGGCGYVSMLESSAELRDVVRSVPDPGGGTRVYWGDAYSCIALGARCPTPSMLLSRERARAAGDFDEALTHGEDRDYQLRVCAAGPAGVLDIPSVRRHGGERESELDLAEGALQTLLTALETGGERVKIEASQLRRSLAALHRRVACAHDDRSAARRHLILSLAHDPKELSTWTALARAMLPRRLSERIRRRS